MDTVQKAGDINDAIAQALSRTLKTMSRYGLVTIEKSNGFARLIAQAERYEISA